MGDGQSSTSNIDNNNNNNNIDNNNNNNNNSNNKDYTYLAKSLFQLIINNAYKIAGK